MSSSDNIGSKGSPVSGSPVSCCSASSSSAEIDSGLREIRDSVGGEEGRFTGFSPVLDPSSSHCSDSVFPVSDVDVLDGSTT